MKKLYIRSGTCRMGEVGLSTPIKDVNGEVLFVGDIVAIYTVREDYIAGLHSMTAIVDGSWTSYSNGKHIKAEVPQFFAMGLASVDVSTSKNWRCLRMKSHKDVIHGEKWKDFGFNYFEEEEIPASLSEGGKEEQK